MTPKFLRNSPNLSLPPRPEFGSPKGPEVKIEIETEGAESKSGSMPDGDEDGARAAAGYVSPEQRCGTCSHCEENRCQLFDFTCDPDGGCPDYEMGESEEQASVPPVAEEVVVEE